MPNEISSKFNVDKVFIICNSSLNFLSLFSVHVITVERFNTDCEVNNYKTTQYMYIQSIS